VYQAIIFLDQIIRQRRDAEALLAGADQAQNVVDLEVGLARPGAVAAGIDQPSCGSADAAEPVNRSA